MEIVKDDVTLESLDITNGTDVTVDIRGAVSPPVESEETKNVPAKEIVLKRE